MAFLNPLFLFGGLAVAVPILLHFIRRQKARRVEFPTLLFLRKIDKKAIRYQKLRHLLLLLLRILAFLFLVFAFMRPYRKEAPVSAAVVGRAVAAHVLALDNSMSMRYQDRWNNAKTAAADIVRRSSDGDRFAVVEFSDTSVIRVSFTSDTSAVLEEIEDIPDPGDRPTGYVQALRAAEEIAREAATAERVIHLISDFQKTGWTDEAREFQLGAGIELRTVDVGSDAFSNLAIQNVRAVEEDRDGNSELRIQASIAGFGIQDRENVRVGLTVDGREMAEKAVNVAGAGSEEIEFRVPELKSGEHSVVLEIDDPYLEPDNRFYMTIDVREKTPVIVVEKPEPRQGRTPSFFLARALNVDRLSPYQVKVVSPQDPDISAGLLIWNDITTTDPRILNRLEDFVRSGGGLILVLGNSTGASEFNRGFGARLPVRMEPAVYGTERSLARPEEDFVLMTDIRTDHPVFQPFGKRYSGTFSGARFYNHARIVAGPGTEILARFDNGDPALVATGMDKGRILIFASSADDTGNDLPLSAVYAPFWQQMLRYLESYENQRYWLEVGDFIVPDTILSGKAFRRGEDLPGPGEAVAVLDPARQRLEIPQDSQSIVAAHAGFYEIRTMGVNAKVAVNTVAAESDLTHHNAGEMAALWVQNGSAMFPGNEDVTAEEKDRSRRIWLFLLLAALLFLISESFLSGRGAKSEREADYERATRNAG
ncbi:MAG: BatA domain-containing protein [Acidobacteria bacterium]|nr:BatA domain-containing protein [Acidobacteriota bacterium]